MPDTANADSQRALSEAREAWEQAKREPRNAPDFNGSPVVSYEDALDLVNTADIYIAALEAARDAASRQRDFYKGEWDLACDTLRKVADQRDAALARVGELEAACGDMAENVKRWQNKEASVRKRFRKSQDRTATLEATAREVAGELRELADALLGDELWRTADGVRALANRLAGESDGDFGPPTSPLTAEGANHPPPPWPTSKDPRTPECRHDWPSPWGRKGETQRLCAHCGRWIWSRSIWPKGESDG